MPITSFYSLGATNKIIKIVPANKGLYTIRSFKQSLNDSIAIYIFF